MNASRYGNPPGKTLGTALFWISAGVLVVAPLVPWWWMGVVLALIAIEPIIYATHEALHIESNDDPAPDLYAPRTIATVGMAFQLQNIVILRLAHLFHHRLGRYGDGWAPDITVGRPTVKERCRYYVGLVFLPAFAWQVAGLIRPFLPLRFQPYLGQIGYKDSVSSRYALAWLLTLAYPAYYIYFAGPVAFVIYWFGLCFLWSIQQNIAHYGLTGIDPATDRVCAHTYYLPRPFSWITYGSTSHFLHHADMRLRATELYSQELLRDVEQRMKLTVVPKYGLKPYLLDIARQFRGPVPVANLTLDWAENLGRTPKEYVAEYDYRRGRTYTKRVV